MRRRLLLEATCGVALALSGCAVSTHSPIFPTRWAGRLALQVPDDPRQSFSAGFELRGSAQAGELELLAPGGATVALLQWLPGQARLSGPGLPTRQGHSVDDLTRDLTGAAVPVSALFDWLEGRPAEVPGWQVDLSAQAQGRLSARRQAAPQAHLRIVMERP